MDGEKERMKKYYKNNLKSSYMVIEEDHAANDFQTQMLHFNQIPGLLNTTVKYINNNSHYYYDISGKTSLKTHFENKKLSGKQIKQLVETILYVTKDIEKYMLDGMGILLDPEDIYCEKEKYYFCYYPGQSENVKEEFHRLTEFFVREVDYKDREGVHMAYTLHKETMEENYSIENIMEQLMEENEAWCSSYSEKAEALTTSNIAIAEKKELWEPIKKLLERTKKEKWGKWEGL